MATITVRNLDDEVRDALRRRGTANGRSMEGEAREILTAAVTPAVDDLRDLAHRIHALFGDVDVPVIERASDPGREDLFDS